MASSSSSAITSLAGNFGRMWRRGHESFSQDSRKILSVTGAGATTYLQGLVTSDLLTAPPPPREEVDVEEGDEDYAAKQQFDNSSSQPPPPLVEFSEKLRATCFLDNKGRIVTDSLLWKLDETHYLIDVPGDMGDSLLQHLKQFVLRKTKVKVKHEQDMSAHVVYGTLNAHGTPKGYTAGVDPRHPCLGMRILQLENNNFDSGNVVMNEEGTSDNTSSSLLSRMLSKNFPVAPGTYNVVRKLAGVAEGSELFGKIAIESNQEFLNAVSFRKGCYLGQELTARVQYTGSVRKRIMPIMLLDTNMQIPPPWLVASQLQQQQLQSQSQQQQQGEDDEDNIIAGSGGSSSSGPRLPRLSPTAAGAIVGMISGEGGGNGNAMAESPELSQLRAQSQVLMDTLQTTISRGDKIQDIKDGKTIGQIIATPELGTNVVLAQMRMDRVGLLGHENVWSHTNKIVINSGAKDGNGNEQQQQLRYLPYLPLWWPEIDRTSGKAVQ